MNFNNDFLTYYLLLPMNNIYVDGADQDMWIVVAYEWMSGIHLGAPNK